MSFLLIHIPPATLRGLTTADLYVNNVIKHRIGDHAPRPTAFHHFPVQSVISSIVLYSSSTTVPSNKH